MENRIKVQELQENQSCMELTPEELAELEAIKGGASLSLSTAILFPYGIPVIDIFKYQIPQISQIPQVQVGP
jgi:hypothetical protein